MGGCIPLGYRVEARKLIEDKIEAATVRHIFERYLELGTVAALLADLRARGVPPEPRTIILWLTNGQAIAGNRKRDRAALRR